MIHTFFIIAAFSLFSHGQTPENELHQIYQNAEAAMQRSDYSSAKESYLLLLQKEWTSDWPTYVDIVTRLVKVELTLNEYEEAETLLLNLLRAAPPDEFIPRIQLLQAHCYCEKGKMVSAYFIMKKIGENWPIESWCGEDRSLFHAVEFSLDSTYDTLTSKARRFSAAGIYVQAAEMYEEVMEAIVEGLYPKAVNEDSLIKKNVQYRLAEAHYQAANYEKTLELIESAEKQLPDQELLFLAALAYSEKREYERALDCYKNYVRSADRADLCHYDHAIFEIGLASFRTNNLAKAQRHFEIIAKISDEKKKPSLLANIFLAKIHLRKNQPNVADKILFSLSSEIPQKDDLQYEIAYLRGEAAFQTGEYAQAADFFESSLPISSVATDWRYQALYKLAWSYLKSADDVLKSEKVRGEYIGRSEKLFLRLMGTKEQEKAILALGRLYLIAGNPQKCETLLTKQIASLTLEDQTQALLLRAEAAPEYEMREQLYLAATDEIYRPYPTYAESWYLRGLNDFRHKAYEKAIFALEKAFLLSKRERASEILKLEARANFYLDAPLASFALLEKLLGQFTLSEKDKEEVLYLRGLIASRIRDETFFPIAEESFSQVISLYPGGEFANNALHALASLYYQQGAYEKARERFVQLAQTYPTSYLAAEAWFWAGAAADKLGQEGNHFRQTLVQEYPDSPRAAEAYFRFYPMDDYLEGKVEAMKHLQTFSAHFPDSPLVVMTHYLFGTNEPLFSAAKQSFEAAEEAFQKYYEENKIQDSSLIYFRYRSIYELALLHLSNERAIPTAIEMLEAIVNDFRQKDHPLTAPLMKESDFPSLFEESEFALAQAYLQFDQEYKAQETLSSMLSHYASANINQGYYLSHVWLEQAKLAGRCNDEETALRCIVMAQESGKGYLSIDQGLNLWILQSECYRNKGQLNQAMRMLSQVINEDVVSSLRLKAMFLRAEIYELQGREELAMRQLEATAKKGGEWADLATEKLRSDYGIY
ncbi:MAG: hypothetical protein KR126chlam2_00912 [Chlamydiae bacterium]|nr:hypothetical protein [Chlamydiota bacterium]